MSHLKLLLTYFWKSCTSFAFYRTVQSTPLTSSFTYYLWFSVLLGILLTIVVCVVMIPPAHAVSRRFEKRAYLLFPENAQIEVKNGLLSSNLNEPLRIPLPYELFFDTPPAVTDQDQVYLLTIDTHATPSGYSNSQSLVVVTKTQLAIKNPNNTYESIALSEFGDFKIDKNRFDQFLQQLSPFVRHLPFIVAIFSFIFLTVFLTLGRILMILLTMIVLLPIAKVLLPHTHFRQLCALAFTAATLPTLLQTTMYAIGLIPPLPFFFPISLGLFMMIVISELRNKPKKI